MSERTPKRHLPGWAASTAVALMIAGIACTARPAGAVPAGAGLDGKASPGIAREGAPEAGGMLQPVYYRRHGRAGLYKCGGHALKTHLERQACGSFYPSRDRMRRRGY